MVATETRLPPLNDDVNSILRINSPKSGEGTGGRSLAYDRKSPQFSGTQEYEEEEEKEDGNMLKYVDDFYTTFHQSLKEKAGQPQSLSKDETIRYRMDTRQMLYTDMLRKGFNQSHREIFTLERAYRRISQLQGFHALNISDQHLKTLCEKVTLVEAYERNNSFIDCYTTLKLLTEQLGDTFFLQEHFLKRAFQFASKVEVDDNQRSLADAHKSLGSFYFQRENYEQALEHLNKYMEIVEQSSWKNLPNEFNFYIDACNQLRLFYIRLGESSSDPEEALDHYQMAHSYAALCDNKQQIKQVSHKLALIYEKLGQPEMAVAHLEKFFEIAQQSNDFHNLDSAAEVFAKVFEKLKQHYDVKDTLDILEAFTGSVEKTDDRYGQVCSCLGSIYTCMGEMELAQTYLRQSYEAAMAKSSTDALDDSKLQVSIASAHQMLGHFMHMVESNSAADVKKILQWKNNRINITQQ